MENPILNFPKIDQPHPDCEEKTKKKDFYLYPLNLSLKGKFPSVYI